MEYSAAAHFISILKDMDFGCKFPVLIDQRNFDVGLVNSNQHREKSAAPIILASSP